MIFTNQKASSAWRVKDSECTHKDYYGCLHEFLEQSTSMDNSAWDSSCIETIGYWVKTNKYAQFAKNRVA